MTAETKNATESTVSGVDTTIVSPADVGDSSKITKVVLPPTGGVLTFLEKFKYPFKGLPQKPIVETMRVMKKIVPVALRLAFTQPLRTILIFSFILAFLYSRKKFKSFVLKFVDSFIDYAHPIIKPYFPDPRRYCTCAREIYRVITLELNKIPDVEERLTSKNMTDEVRMRIRVRRAREIGCMLLEFDNAYRFRVQDVAHEANMEKLRSEKCYEEVKRLFGILIEREMADNFKERWGYIRKILVFVLRWNKPVRSKFIDIMKNLEIERIKSDNSDIYYSLRRKDYNCLGLPYEERNKRFEEDHNKKVAEITLKA